MNVALKKGSRQRRLSEPVGLRQLRSSIGRGQEGRPWYRVYPNGSDEFPSVCVMIRSTDDSTAVMRPPVVAVKGTTLFTYVGANVINIMNQRIVGGHDFGALFAHFATVTFRCLHREAIGRARAEIASAFSDISGTESKSSRNRRQRSRSSQGTVALQVSGGRTESKLETLSSGQGTHSTLA